MWKYYALLSAFFAALTAILAKVGVKGVNGNVATAIRTLIVLLFGIIVPAEINFDRMRAISPRSPPMNPKFPNSASYVP
ncbi:hypothetical protein EZS27_035612, partial [termite gut metagenome]